MVSLFTRLYMLFFSYLQGDRDLTYILTPAYGAMISIDADNVSAHVSCQ